MANRHGVFIQEEATPITVPKESSAGIQVIVGTAPVNLADDPEAVVNVPILANSAAEAKAALGFSTDFANYTLCQSMYVTGSVYAVSPCVYINVLDPAKHKTSVSKTVTVADLTATVDVAGVLKKGLVVQTVGEEPAQLVLDTDYVLSFDVNGYLVVTLISTSEYAEATSLLVSGNKIDPSAVTYEDIIGGYDASTGAETGLEVIRQVYPTFNIVPAILLAPGWSQIPAVGIALAAKAASLNGSFKAMAFVDIPCGSGGATKYTDVKTVKENCGFASEFMVAYWPKVVIGDYTIYLSALAAARTAYSDAEHDDVPSKSPSNISLAVTGVVLEDGTEVKLDQDRATTVDGFGVCTAVNLGGFKLWGNYTCAYPSSGDAKDIWISVRRMFNWQANNFILTYFDKVDDPMNTKLIENIVDSENIRCGAYVPEHWAGAYIEYLAEDNPTTDILAGRITFRQHISPYTPAETITDILSYDVDTLTAALTGGE